MPTALELAEQQATRRLARAGLGPDGKPLDPKAQARAGARGGQPDFEVPDLDEHDDPDRQDDTGDEGDDGQDGSDNSNTALLERIAQLERDLQATQGRVAPVQQGLDQYRQLYETERSARELERGDLQQQLNALQAQLNERNSQLNIEELLTEEERADFDPKLLTVVTKLADKIAQARAPKVDARGAALEVLEEREKRRVQQYRERVLTDPARGLHQLGTLAYDPAFMAWSKEEDNDMDSVVNSLLNASSTEEVDRYAKIVAKRIVKYKEDSKKPRDGVDPPQANARTNLGNHMRRQPKAALTQAEVDEKMAQAKRLARSSNPADRQKAQQLINELK